MFAYLEEKMEKFEISQEDINQYVANGGDLGELTDEQIEAIPQDVVNQRAANGGGLGGLTDEQRKAISQEIINQYVVNGGYLHELTPEQIEKIPQNVVNQYVANGGRLGGLTDEQRKAIPQEIINQYVANGGYLNNLTYKQIEAIPQEIINQRAANGWSFGGLTAKQIAAIPRGILEFDEKMRNALILYAAGKIKKDDLPNEVYANYKSRRILLGIIKTKLIKKFNQICDEKGFGEYVPHELKKVFDEKCAQIRQEVKEKQQQAVLQLGKEQKGLVENAKREIEDMGW